MVLLVLGLVGLGVVAIAAIWAVSFLGARRLEETSDARLYGWEQLAMQFAATTPPPPGVWTEHRFFFMTKRRGQRGETRWWKRYVTVESLATGQGWYVRNRRAYIDPDGEPTGHRLLLLPYDALAAGVVEDLKGDGLRQPVVVVDVPACDGIAVAMLVEDASQVAAASKGTWRIEAPAPNPGLG